MFPKHLVRRISAINKDTEQIVYLLIFSFALLFRTINLGGSPLSDYEAGTAFQALSISRLQMIEGGVQVGYLGITAILFYLFDANSFFARIWPAIFGSLIVFIPYLWRKRIGGWQSIVIASAFALDPLLLAASRQVGSSIFGVVGLLLGGSLFLQGSWIMAGIFLAIGFLGGESFWMGVTILSFFVIISRITNGQTFISLPKPDKNIGKFLFSFLATILIVGSSFGFYTAGLSGIGYGVLAFFNRFLNPSGLAFWQPTAALLIYEFLPLFLGTWIGIRAWAGIDQEKRCLSLIALFGLALITLMPGRQIVDLLWVVIPLWILAVNFFFDHLELRFNRKLPLFILSLFIFIILGYVFMNFRTLADSILIMANVTGSLIAIGAGILLLLLSLMLIGLGWQFHLAWHSFFIGCFVFLLMFMLSGSLKVLNKDVDRPFELWQLGDRSPTGEIMVETIEFLLRQPLTSYMNASIAVVNLPETEFVWVFRDYEQVKFYNHLPNDQQPEFVITALENIPQLAANYRGESYVWHKFPNWEKMNFVDHLRYLVNREVNWATEEIILWVRADLFPGGSIIN